MLQPRYSVVIPTLNEIRYLPRLLNSLRNQTYQPSEILIVDANSTDGTAQLATKTATLVRSSRKNIAFQRSVGADLARGEYIIFLDADCILPNTFFEMLTNKINVHQYQSMIPSYLPYPGNSSINAVFSFFNTLFFLGQFAWPSGVGSCMIVKKTVWNQVAPFQQNILVEDLEFINRVGKKTHFAMLPGLKVRVSDRRFREEGVWNVCKKYLHISYHGLRNQWQHTNHIKYDFGQHDQLPHGQKLTT